ncbi:MAG: hypothetical protein J6N76_01210 [Lachnospiraceae bacterium]|nr:hypothetical protein [Lachnospiraceae bacterium]
MDIFEFDPPQEMVLCGASAYNKKFYLNPDFNGLPETIKQELKLLCVLFTEEIGGTFELIFDEDGSLFIRTDCEEEDILYDEIGSGLMVKEVQRGKKELFHSLELYYKAVYLGQDPEEL